MKYFSKIKSLENGELIFKFPGTNIKLIYTNGEAFLNNQGIGYVSLAIRDIECQENGNADGEYGRYGRHFAEQINEPIARQRLRSMLSKSDHSLFYSKLIDGNGFNGLEYLTLPGISPLIYRGFGVVFTQYFPSYLKEADIPLIDSIYYYHMEMLTSSMIIRDFLITDEEALEGEVLNLVPKANKLYEKALEFMKTSNRNKS